MSKEELTKRICEAAPSLPYHERIQKIHLFGSQLHGDAKEDSDVDLLIELSEPLSFFKLFAVEAALKAAVGKEVDLITPEFLSKYFREDVFREALIVYER